MFVIVMSNSSLLKQGYQNKKFLKNFQISCIYNKDLNFISSDRHSAETIELRDTIMVMNIWMKTGIDGTSILIVKKWELVMAIVLF